MADATDYTRVDDAFTELNESNRKHRRNIIGLESALVITMVIGTLWLIAITVVASLNWEYSHSIGRMLKHVFKFADNNNGFGLLKDIMTTEVRWLFKTNVSFMQYLSMEDGGGIHLWPPPVPPLHLIGKRSADEANLVLPSAQQYGIYFHNGPLGIIDMDGGDIINVDVLQANIIIGDLVSVVNGSTADNIAPGLVVGLLRGGNVSVGFNPNPLYYDPVANQAQNTLAGTSQLLRTARIGTNKTASIYFDDAGAIQLFVTVRDDDTGDNINSAPVEVLPAGIAVLRTALVVSLGDSTYGFLNSVVLIWVNDDTSDNIYARVIDLTDPTAPVFQDPWGVNSPGFAALKTIAPRLQDATAISHVHVASEDPSSRWIILAFSDTTGNNSAVPLTANETATGTPVPTSVAGGWVYGFNVLANASMTPLWPLNYTGLRQIGTVYDLTSESNSTDLSGDCNKCIKVQYTGVSQTFGVSSRTGAGLRSLQFELEKLVLPDKSLNLTADGRLAGYTLPPEYNTVPDTYMWDHGIGNVDASGIQYLHVAYIIGGSQFGHVFTAKINNSASTSDTFTAQFGPDAEYPFSVYANGFLSIASTCADRVIVSYVNTKYGRQETVSVLISSLTPSLCSPSGCQYVGTRASVSSYSAYNFQTVWQNLNAQSYSCSALTDFFTVFATLNEFNVVNTSISMASGLVGSYSISYADNVRPVYVVGVATKYTNLTSGVVEYQSGGAFDVASTAYPIIGASCPLQTVVPVYACTNGSISISPYCASSKTTSPGPYIGLASPPCTVTIAVAPPVA